MVTLAAKPGSFLRDRDRFRGGPVVLSEEVGNSIWGMLASVGAPASRKEAGIERLQQIMTGYVARAHDWRIQARGADQAADAAALHQAIKELIKKLKQIDREPRRRFYEELAEANGKMRGRRAAGRKIADRYLAELEATSRRALKRADDKVRRGRDYDDVALQEACTALAILWVDYTGQKFTASHSRNAKPGKGLNSSEFVLSALELGLNAKIKGTVEHLLRQTKKDAKANKIYPSASGSGGDDDAER